MNDGFNDLMGRLMFGSTYPYVNFLFSDSRAFQPDPRFTQQVPETVAPRPDMSPEERAAMKAYWDNVEMQSQTSPYENVVDYPYYWSNGMPMVNPVPPLGYGY